MDFSSSIVDDRFDSAKLRYSKDDGWVVLIFSHVNDLKICMDKIVFYFDKDISYYTFNLSKCLVYHLELNVCWLKGHGSIQELIGDRGHYVDA